MTKKKISDIEFGFREMRTGPGIRGSRQTRIEHTFMLMVIAILFVLVGAGLALWTHFSHADTKLVGVSIFLIALGAGLGFLNISRNDNDARKHLRDIDEGRAPDADGVIFDSRSSTIRVAQRLGVKPPKGW